MRKKRVLISFVIAYALFIGIIIFSIVLGLYKSELFETPPKPEITYGEFPFKLEYELNGKKYTVEDVWVCSFSGFGANEGTGRYRQWKGKVKGTGKDKIVLLDVEKPTTLSLGGDALVKQIIYFSPGSAGYYMGDMMNSRNVFPDAFYWEYSFPFKTFEGMVEAEEMQEKFNLKLINWEIAAPIENTFE